MLATLGVLLLAYFAVPIVAATWTFVIGFASIPGGLIAGDWKPDWKWNSRGRLTLGLIVAFIGQAYTALAFAGALVGGIRMLQSTGRVVVWVLFIAGLLYAYYPIRLAAKDVVSRHESAATLNCREKAVMLAVYVPIPGFLIFWFFPEVLRLGWGWLPFVT